MSSTGDSLSMDDYRRIIKTVIENSSKESWWYRWSKFSARNHAFEYSMIEDEEVLRLCEKALDESEEHADNLREYVSELQAEVERGRQLEKEYNEIAYSGPMGAGLIQRLNEWKAKHDGFTPYRLHETEFILGYCKGVLKDSKPIPMPPHIKSAFERYPDSIEFGVADGKEVAFSLVALKNSSLKKSAILNEENLALYFYNPSTNRPFTKQGLKKLDSIK